MVQRDRLQERIEDYRFKRAFWGLMGSVGAFAILVWFTWLTAAIPPPTEEMRQFFLITPAATFVALGGAEVTYFSCVLARLRRKFPYALLR